MFILLKRIGVNLFERASVLSEKLLACAHKVFVKNKNQAAVEFNVTEEELYHIIGTKASIALVDKGNWHLVLINKHFRVPDDYEIDLAHAVSGYDVKVDSRVAKHFGDMVNAAQRDGLNLVPETGYRSIAVQRNSFNGKVKYYADLGHSEIAAVKKTATIFAVPGCSEHNAGLAIDITNLEKKFKNSKEFKWLIKNAVDYGFILRYPKNKKTITGIRYEPWHWRYVGVEDAKAIKSSGQCLEEYLKI